MNRIKYIIIASFVALLILFGISYLIDLNKEKNYINIAFAKTEIGEGENINDSNITWVKLDATNIDSEIYITKENIGIFKDCVAKELLEKGRAISRQSLIKNEEYLENTEGFEYIALPIKSATEGVCYKIKKGDRISVYYTAKKKLVDGILKNKKKIYSIATADTLVTCLLYENIEIIATTNNFGSDVSGSAITDVVIRLTQDEAMELANLKDQGTFTLAVI